MASTLTILIQNLQIYVSYSLGLGEDLYLISSNLVKKMWKMRVENYLRP
jgi:hypothetical protein